MSTKKGLYKTDKEMKLYIQAAFEYERKERFAGALPDGALIILFSSFSSLIFYSNLFQKN